MSVYVRPLVKPGRLCMGWNARIRTWHESNMAFWCAVRLDAFQVRVRAG